MNKLLAAIAIICMCVTQTKAETSSCASLGLLTFPGNNGPGSINLTGAFPGDVLISVQSVTSGFWTSEYVNSFVHEILSVPDPNPAFTAPAIFQSDSRNFSTITFVALVCRKH